MKRAAIVFSFVSLVTTTALATSPGTSLTTSPSLVLVPISGAGPRILASEERVIERSPMVARALPVFTSSERKALAELGDRALGSAFKVELKNLPAAPSAFAAWVAARAPHFRLEKNPVVRASALDPLQSLQWGVANQGRGYSIEVDDFTTKHLAGVAGEDIGSLRAPTVRPGGVGPKDIIVAVLDTGIDLEHPDLKGALARNEKECVALEAYRACSMKLGTARCDSEYRVDHDGNGYPLDCNGWNLAPEDDGHGFSSSAPIPKSGELLGNTHVSDLNGHGTHVAGIIAARFNGIGGRGVALNAKILPVRVISGEPSENIRAQEVGATNVKAASALAMPDMTESKLAAGHGLGDIVARGVLYAVRSGAQVINMSLGYPDPLDSELIRRALALARSKGVLLVAAAGNDSTESVIFPCRYDGVICVGAHGPDGALTFFSNFGFDVDILAPGWNIISTYPTGLMPLVFTDQSGYEAKDGTSMAAPFVSGALARLLGAGFTADEAYARLMLGARPTRDSQIEDPRLFAGSSISGNADLERAFAVQAQALVLPAHKGAIRLEWDRRATRLPFSFALTNHWLTAGHAKIRAELTSRQASFDAAATTKTAAARLSTTSWLVDAWPANEERSLETELEILDPRVDSELDLTLTVSADNMPERHYRLRLEIVVPVGRATKSRNSLDPSLKSLALVDVNGARVSRDYDSVRTVVVSSGEKAREYVGVKAGVETKLELLTEMPTGEIKIQGAYTLTEAGVRIAALRKTHDPRSKSPIYALVTNGPAVAGQVGTSSVTWLDSKLRRVANLPIEIVDPSITFLAEDFQMQNVKGEPCATWYGVGRKPLSERKAFNPWKPEQETAPDFHLFILTSSGLKTVALPAEYQMMVSLVPQTAQQLADGAVSVLLARGTDYALDFARAELRDGHWRNIEPLDMGAYHNLHGLVASTALSLEPSALNAGASFSGFVEADSGPKGGRRTTLVGAGSVRDMNLLPIRAFDAITDVSGIYAGKNRLAAFALTKYEIQFHDVTAGKTAMTSLKRFSFLPDIFTIKTVFPLVIEDTELERATGERRSPALFVPGDFLYSRATQVIAPSFDSRGGLVALTRPAKFHLESRDGCTALPTAKAADADGPAELVFFCRDQFLSVPLVY